MKPGIRIGTAMCILGIGLGACAPAATQRASTATSPTALPSNPALVVPTTEAATSLPAPTPTPSLGIGSTLVRAADAMKMLYVPEGEFTMGNDAGAWDERPAHKVMLRAFWMDQTEVTNGMYRLCVDAGVCATPAAKSSFKRHTYYGDPQYDAYPVIGIDWNSASTYCKWAGARLPTEAEWEKAARGMDGRAYPWGNTASCKLANTNGCQGDTSAAGAYSEGISPYGLFDMAGNVLEWTADWYDAKYYASSPASDPVGPATGQTRVVRGGSWYEFADAASTTRRDKLAPSNQINYLGFRCAMDAAGQTAAIAVLAGSSPTPAAMSNAETAGPAASCTRSDITYGGSVWRQAGDGEQLGGRWMEFWFCGSAGDLIDITVVTKPHPLDAAAVVQCPKTTFGLRKLQLFDTINPKPIAQAELLGVNGALTGYSLPHDGEYRIFMAYYGNGPNCHGATVTLNKR